jgi:uncharacterized protein (TIGR03118 family)
MVQRAQNAAHEVDPRQTRIRIAGSALVAGLLIIASVPVAAFADDLTPSRYVQTNLVSDVPGIAQMTDPSLVNAWGMSFSATSPVWVSDNGADVATLYVGATLGTPVAKVPLTVSIPDGAPTGQVFNPTGDFVVSAGGASGPARFIFASENGSIDAWNPGVPPPAPSTMAQSMVTVSGAVYKGLTISTGGGDSLLFAANFHDNRVDVFDGSFQLVQLAGSFSDPMLPTGYAPFDVANLGGRLFVTYAKQDSAAHDDVAGQGHGLVDVFDLQGHLVRRLISHGRLNSPWGLAIAPAGFGQFSGDLLVGNFGDGRVNAYDPTTGEFVGVLSSRPGKPIVIDGLWGLLFGNGTAGTPTTLLFSAGPDGEQHGLFGAITLAP